MKCGAKMYLEYNEYLQMAQRLQAEFDNYRKRSADIVKNARIEGIVEAVTKMFPAIDSIEKAKVMIKDEKVLQGVEMIEKDLTLKQVEEIYGIPTSTLYDSIEKTSDLERKSKIYDIYGKHRTQNQKDKETRKYN